MAVSEMNGRTDDGFCKKLNGEAFTSRRSKKKNSWKLRDARVAWWLLKATSTVSLLAHNTCR